MSASLVLQLPLHALVLATVAVPLALEYTVKASGMIIYGVYWVSFGRAREREAQRQRDIALAMRVHSLLRQQPLRRISLETRETSSKPEALLQTPAAAPDSTLPAAFAPYLSIDESDDESQMDQA